MWESRGSPVPASGIQELSPYPSISWEQNRIGSVSLMLENLRHGDAPLRWPQVLPLTIPSREVCAQCKRGVCIRAWSFSPVAPNGCRALCTDAQVSYSMCQFSLCLSCPSLPFLGIDPYDIQRRYSPILNRVLCVMEIGFRVNLKIA